MANRSLPIAAVIYHRQRPLRTRRYARINTAVPRAITWLLLSGEPGDLVEFSMAEFGTQLAVVKVHAGGRIIITLTE